MGGAKVTGERQATLLSRTEGNLAFAWGPVTCTDYIRCVGCVRLSYLDVSKNLNRFFTVFPTLVSYLSIREVTLLTKKCFLPIICLLRPLPLLCIPRF